MKSTGVKYIESESIIVKDETSETEGDKDNHFHSVYGILGDPNHGIKHFGSSIIGVTPSSTAFHPISKYYQKHSWGARHQAPGIPVRKSRGLPTRHWLSLSEAGVQ